MPLAEVLGESGLYIGPGRFMFGGTRADVAELADTTHFLRSGRTGRSAGLNHESDWF
jgi:hypothetical protein